MKDFIDNFGWRATGFQRREKCFDLKLYNWKRSARWSSSQLLWNPWMKLLWNPWNECKALTKRHLTRMRLLHWALTLQLTPVLPVQLNAQWSLCHRVHGYAALEDSSWDHHTKQHNNYRINERNRKLYISRSMNCQILQIPIHYQADLRRIIKQNQRFSIGSQHLFQAATNRSWKQTGICRAQKKH